MVWEEKQEKPLTVEECARGQNPRRWCYDCGNEFKKMPVGNDLVFGCKACWHKRDYHGPVPKNAAPHGEKAACAIIPSLPTGWTVYRSLSAGVLQPRNGVPGSLPSLELPIPSKGRGASKENRSPRKESRSPRKREGSKQRASQESVRNISKSASTPALMPAPSKDRPRWSLCAIPGQVEWEEIDEEDDQDDKDAAQMEVLSKLYKKAKVRLALDKLVAQVLAKGNIYEVFEKFDQNGDKTLSKDEMRVGLRSIGCSLLPIELDAVIRAFDADGNDSIDYVEFYSILRYHQSQMPRLSTPVEEDSFQGYKKGDLVRSLIKATDKSADKHEVGMVIGDGVRRGLVRVYFSGSTSEVSVKPTQITRYEAKTQEKEREVTDKMNKSYSEWLILPKKQPVPIQMLASPKRTVMSLGDKAARKTAQMQTQNSGWRTMRSGV